jgi:hypothetical protein
MFKVAMTAAFALGMGLAGISTGHAGAAAPGAGVLSALESIDMVEQAQFVDKRVHVRPGGTVVRRSTVVGPGGGVARRTTVVTPGARVVGPGRVVGPARVYGRPAYVRAYRPWVRRPYFGTVVGGIALGTILTAAAVGVAPAYAPGPGTCWYWADPSMTQGYWDYC